MDIRLVTGTTGAPIDLVEAKNHLFITVKDHDTEVQRKLNEATRWVERKVGGYRQFMPATYDVSFDSFPSTGEQRITLPLPPLGSITRVVYFNSTGASVSSTGGSTSFSSTHFHTIRPTDAPGYIQPVFGKTWPATRERPDAVTVRFIAGYGSTVASTGNRSGAVPDEVKAAIKLKMEQLWDPERVKTRDLNITVDSLIGGSEYGHYS